MTTTHTYVGIGSNIDREKNISDGLDELRSRYGFIEVSPVYETRPIGFDGNNFLNLVAGFDTRLSITALEAELRKIEYQYGRHRNKERFSSRTLDIDLLLYGNLISVRHKVPREDITQYAFVTKPLFDLAPDLIHPVNGKSIKEIWHEFALNEGDIKQIRFDTGSSLI